MTECQHCNSTLVTDGLSSGQQIRCANCLAISTFGQVEKVETHRLAWRSFWLGLSSVFLLFLTGLPAIYYGIRSLLRMRFVKPKSSDRAAAIAGTALGGCFGIIVGFVAVCLAIIGLIGYLTYQESNNQVEVVQRCEKFFEFDFPAGIIPIKATSLFNNVRSFDFADGNQVSQRMISIRLRHDGANIQTNKERFIATLRSRRVRNQSMGKPQPSETLKWEMDGEVVDVRKTIYSRPHQPVEDEPNSAAVPAGADAPEKMVETHQYYAYLSRPKGFYGLVVVFEPNGIDLSESDVKAIFANIKIVDQLKIPASPEAK